MGIAQGNGAQSHDVVDVFPALVIPDATAGRPSHPAGQIGIVGPKNCLGRLLPVEVNPGMCSVTVPRALKSAELERSKPRRILPIAPEPNPSSATTPDQLAGSSKTVGKHLIDQQVEPDLLTRPEPTPVRRSDGYSEKVPVSVPDQPPATWSGAPAVPSTPRTISSPVLEGTIRTPKPTSSCGSLTYS